MYKIIKLLIALYLCLCFIGTKTTIGYSFGDDVFLRFRRQANGCELPAHPKNGFWKIFDATVSFQPGTFVPSGKVLVIDCNENYKLIGSKTILCSSDEWSEPIGRCLRTCSSRRNTTYMSVTCTFNNVPLPNCKNPFEGTISRFKCADFYEDLSLERHPVHICINGRWSHDVPLCEPICGQKTVSDPTLIVNGDNVTRGDYPWQTAIYNMTSKLLICGGSLINQKIILTAAHCLTDARGNLFSKERYGVAVGKYYRPFDDPRDRDETQFSLVQEIYIPRQYKGEIQNYVADIGIIITKKSFQLSLNVQPVCLDWELKYEHLLQNSSKTIYGYVSGWGFTVEFKNPSEVLKHLKVPLVSNEKCLKYIPEDYERFLTDDKLCAGFLDSSTSVCQGDSGGGLVFKYGFKYYIMGIVSNSPQAATAEGGCDSQLYALYTKVSDYTRDFILEKEAQFRPSNADFIECEDGSYSCTTPTAITTSTTTQKTPEEIPKDKCIFPEQPKSGHLSLPGLSDSLTPGTPVYAGTVLELTCDENYQLSGSKIIACRSGNWSSNIGQCLTTCPSLSETDTTLVTCTFENKDTSCHSPLAGTVARYKCASFYEDPQFSKNPVRVCRDGSWDQKVPECVPVCGQKSVKSTPLIIGGHDSVRGEYPWQVQIYKHEEQKKMLICGGTLLNQRVILTAAHCITRFNGALYPKEMFTVAVGKFFNKYDDPRDFDAQYSTLNEMFVPVTYRGSTTNYFADIAILITNDTFKLSLNVQPACVDWALQFEKEFSNKSSQLRGYISGWGFTSPEGPISEKLLELEVPYVDENVCLQNLPETYHNYLGPDKICAGYLNESKSACVGDTGGGIVFKHNNRFYVTGVLSLSPVYESRCNKNQYALYTRVSYFIDFILEKEAQFRPTSRRQGDEACDINSDNCLQQNKTKVEILKSSCVLPSYPSSGQWSVFGAPSSNLLPGMSVALGTILEVKCNDRFELDGDQFLLCEKKGWSTNLGKCLRTCPSLRSTATTKIKCTFQNKAVANCTDPLEGTIAMFECSPFYEIPTMSRPPSLTCKDGAWSEKPLQCVAICGQKAVSTQALIINGKSIAKGEYPWHVGIYRKQNSDFQYICGGTLISQKVVLTAAKCVTDNNGHLEPKDNLRIGVGKYYSKYEDPRDSAEAQYSMLEATFIPKRFRGPLGDYIADIAVIISTKTFTLSTTVQPVCMDWNLKYESRLIKLFKTKAYLGCVPGWGFTEEGGNLPDELKGLKVPGINYEDCIDAIPSTFQRFLTYDKMCAGYLNNGTSLCKGDSGGGLVFIQDGRYYLTGIVSLAPANKVGGCDSQQYALYTKVSIYITFIVEKTANSEIKDPIV